MSGNRNVRFDLGVVVRELLVPIFSPSADSPQPHHHTPVALGSKLRVYLSRCSVAPRVLEALTVVVVV